MCSNKAKRIQALSGGVNAILRSGLILESIRRMFLLSIWATRTMYMNFDVKHSSKVLENQTRLKKALTPTEKALIFKYSAVLYLNTFHQV